MTKEVFEELVKKLNLRLGNLRNKKGKVYAPGKDRLQNFKTSAQMNHETIPSAIQGMRSKQTVSIADMLRMEYREKSAEFSIAEWEEKLFDEIIYLQLLYAAILEDKDEL